MDFKNKNYWALILGGSSGFGLATAKSLSKAGMNICIAHRDRRGSMDRINKDFDEIRANGVKLEAYNTNALEAAERKTLLDDLSGKMGNGKIRVYLHSIAFGNLKLLAPIIKKDVKTPVQLLAEKAGVSEDIIKKAANELFEAGNDAFINLADPAIYNNDLLTDDEDLSNTIFSMGTSYYTWAKDVFTRKLFAPDARMFGLTSEGNEIAWRGYASVGAAKVAMEALSRSMASEFGPYGIRSNIIQAGVTDTPALRHIPGNLHISANARLRNPLGRLTVPEDVGNVIRLLATDEAGWINGTIIRVDGGEHIAG
ncbi:MAG: SDR family oxidoreductase [Spirochaetia bacterium]|nr:SDR family oxidoreductase [Spirochaetia bacterium]